MSFKNNFFNYFNNRKKFILYGILISGFFALAFFSPHLLLLLLALDIIFKLLPWLTKHLSSIVSCIAGALIFIPLFFVLSYFILSTLLFFITLPWKLISYLVNAPMYLWIFSALIFFACLIITSPSLINPILSMIMIEHNEKTLDKLSSFFSCVLGFLALAVFGISLISSAKLGIAIGWNITTWPFINSFKAISFLFNHISIYAWVAGLGLVVTYPTIAPYVRHACTKLIEYDLPIIGPIKQAIASQLPTPLSYYFIGNNNNTPTVQSLKQQQQ
jgi:hypothetical protein